MSFLLVSTIMSDSEQIDPSYALLFLATHPKEHLEKYHAPILVKTLPVVEETEVTLSIHGQEITIDRTGLGPLIHWFQSVPPYKNYTCECISYV